MRQYQRLIEEILDDGEIESQRAMVKGEQLNTKVLYNKSLEFDLRNKLFPMVTTKSTSFKIVKEELKWFIRGHNNVKTLNEKGITIWNEWADSNGDLGGSYPGCWRNFGGLGGTDQIRQLENLMRLHHKQGPSDETIRKWKRRMILTSWDPNIKDNKGPVGCHTLAQFSITMDGRLHCSMIMRSVDCFLGLPYNIASYALLTNLLAKIGGLHAHKLHIFMINCHLYSNHLDGCRELIRRSPYAPPVLDCHFTAPDDHRDNWSLLEGNWWANLLGHQHHDSIKGDIAV